MLLVGGLALSALSLPSLAAPPNDNAGTVKVHKLNELGEEKNDPKVGCPFYVEGFNMEAQSGTLVIKSWPPTGDMSTVVDDTWSKDGGSPANHFINGPYTLEDGHYKLFVSDVKHDKHKVFWVECETGDDACPPGQVHNDAGECVPIPCLNGEERNNDGNCVPQPCPDGTHRDDAGECVPDTQIPVFPTPTALAVGSVGALVGALLIFRRRST